MGDKNQFLVHCLHSKWNRIKFFKKSVIYSHSRTCVQVFKKLQQQLSFLYNRSSKILNFVSLSGPLNPFIIINIHNIPKHFKEIIQIIQYYLDMDNLCSCSIQHIPSIYQRLNKSCKMFNLTSLTPNGQEGAKNQAINFGLPNFYQQHIKLYIIPGHPDFIMDVLISSFLLFLEFIIQGS